LNRQQLVCINDILSSLELITTGVPQGSILGPLLFFIYINGLPLSSSFLTLLFADDTTLLFKHSDPQQLALNVNLELWKVNNYFRFHKMALHTDKTKYIPVLFTQNVQLKQMDLDIFINNSNSQNTFLENPNSNLLVKLQRVRAEDPIPAIRFLGVYFDPSLNFSYHIQLLCSKLSKSLYILRASKNFITQKASKLIYYSLFHSHLVYCISIWSCTTVNNLNRVTTLQKSAIRILDNARYNSHTEPIFKSLMILPFPKLIFFFNLQLAHFYLTNTLPILLRDMWVLSADQTEANAVNVMQLRPRGTFRLTFTRLAICEKFPLYTLPRLWNGFLEQSIKESTTKIEFNRKLKSFLLDELSAVVVCNRLLCPTCHLQIQN